jgi:dTDP-4-dehydrorhamnose 3,5-epimerase
MKFFNTNLQGLCVIEPVVSRDHRGWFMETYHLSKFIGFGINSKFIQDNHSFSTTTGTLRGLHFQKNPKAQAKLVRCTKGAIFDVAVDIRRGSPTYGQWYGVELTEENKKLLFIPKGFAHGYMTLSDQVEVQYKVDEFYAKEYERGIIWNDPMIGIKWPLNHMPVLSTNDKQAPLLQDSDNNFLYGE